MSEYKDTLNLPKTDFPMKAGLAAREPEMLTRWRDMDLYGKLRALRRGSKKYVLHDGPPYANGQIHIGHAVNKVLKDIVVKAKGLGGYDAPYVPGWDCHGLPIELMVEKKIGKAGAKVDKRRFRQACREYAAEQVENQRADFRRLGVFGDWEGAYLTMDYRFEADIIRALGRMIAAGHVYRGAKPVHWCAACGSALAEAEVEYEDRTSPAIDVRFRVADVEDLARRCEGAHPRSFSAPVSLVIWTTTPWTLPANQAVAVNPQLQYSVVECDLGQGPEYLVVAEALLAPVTTRYGMDEFRVVAELTGDRLEGLLLAHPFYDRTVPVICGDHVTIETGTGAVHTAPGHGLDDYVVGARYGLKVDNPVGGDGRFLPTTELFAGEEVFAANEHVIAELQTRGALVHAARITHSYPHCWRHKTPIIFRATPQWFVSMTHGGLREQALAAIETVKWQPAWGQARIEGMVANRPDWCISRQRTWGVPIALFLHKDSGEPHPRTDELIAAVAARVEQNGIEAWHALDPAELLQEDAADYVKSDDTLDVWFDSGVTHACVLERSPALALPADLYLEGSDQHRGWFQSSLLTAVALRGSAPYRGVLTHGFTVDAQGMKMSKSRGNVVAPQKVVNTLGADILRLWVAATDYRGEMSISDEILKRMGDAYRRIRNTARFLLANLHGFEPGRDTVAPQDMVALDLWAVNRAKALQAELIRAYDEFEFHAIFQKIHNFCAVDMGSFYLDVIKDRQYTTRYDGRARRSTQTAMHHIIEAMVRWLAPVLTFTAEEAWAHIPGARDESVFFSTWYEFPHTEAAVTASKMDLAYWARVIAARAAVGPELERLRAAGIIGSSLDAEVELYCDAALYADLRRLEDELRFVFITSTAHVHGLDDRPADAVRCSLSGGELWARVGAALHPKCARCWHRRADIGADGQHPTLCGRCVTNVAGAGEVRRYA